MPEFDPQSAFECKQSFGNLSLKHTQDEEKPPGLNGTESASEKAIFHSNRGLLSHTDFTEWMDYVDFPCEMEKKPADFIIFVGAFLVKRRVNRAEIIRHFPLLAPYLKDKNSKGVSLEEIRPDIFDLIMKFIRHEEKVDFEAQIDTKFVIPYTKLILTLSAARFLEIQPLVKLCEAEICDMLNKNTCIEVFMEARACDEDGVAEKALSIICGNASEALKSVGFRNLPKKCVTEILKQDGLKVINEKEVFQAACKWGEAECKRRGTEIDGNNLRAVITDFIHQIRFPVMTLEDFNYCIETQNNVLTSIEVSSIRFGIEKFRLKSNNCR